MRLVTKTEVKRRMDRNGIPEGFSPINASVYVNPADGRIVITGDLMDSDEEESAHNCDAAGCNWEHVVFRGQAVGYEREALCAFVAWFSNQRATNSGKP